MTLDNGEISACLSLCVRNVLLKPALLVTRSGDGRQMT